VAVAGTSEKVDVEVVWASGHRTHAQIVRPVACLTQLSYYPQLAARPVNWQMPVTRPRRSSNASTPRATDRPNVAKGSPRTPPTTCVFQPATAGPGPRAVRRRACRSRRAPARRARPCSISLRAPRVTSPSALISRPWRSPRCRAS
jgi:hypothetical protein